jgi:hypothetical protein
MKKEKELYGTVFATQVSIPLRPSDLLITAENFNPDDKTKRPAGWDALKANRIQAKIRASGANGNDAAMNVKRDQLVYFYFFLCIFLFTELH